MTEEGEESLEVSRGGDELETSNTSDDSQVEPLISLDPLDQSKPAPFEFISENIYITERVASKEGKRNKRMMCDCQFDPETDDLSEACGEKCLNRLLMIECGSRCPCGEYCNNKRFTRGLYAEVEVFKTEMKGWGLMANKELPRYSFVMEYCGEVCTPEEFEIRRGRYECDKRRHYYFMSLKTDEIIDATGKGNLSRFINHSCDPNCETQKWTVNGKLRVGFFALRNIAKGEELTFDYQFQRFGESAQKCHCGSENCRGYLGSSKQSSDSHVRGNDSTTRPIGRKSKFRGGNDADSVFERELYDIVGGAWRLRNSDHVLSYSRLMLRAETHKQKVMLLKVLQATKDMNCLKRFLSLQGLRLMWSWMVELSDQHLSEALQTKIEILLALDRLPIPNKNILTDTKILQSVNKWAESTNLTPLLLNDNDNDNVLNDQESVVISEADCSNQEQEAAVAEVTAGSETVPRNDDGQHKEDSNIVTASDGNAITAGDDSNIIMSGGDTKTSDHIGRDHVEDSSSEAEPRESDKQQDEISRKDVITMALGLLDKWSSLKEVFRIPKIVQKIESPSLSMSKESDNVVAAAVVVDRGEVEKVEDHHEWREEHYERRRDYRDDYNDSRHRNKRKNRWDRGDESYHYSRPKRRPSSPGNNKGTAHGILGPSPPGLPPLQNTLIVQHQPGQNVYVQQQIFPPSGPIHYNLTNANNHHSLFISQPPPSLPIISPLQPLQALPVTSSSTAVLNYPIISSANPTNPATPIPPPPPTDSKLPHNWKEARDMSGKIYYYHIITRKTQWDRPTEADRDGDIMMDLGTPNDHDNDSEGDDGDGDGDDSEWQEQQQDESPCPHTPEGSPPPSSSPSPKGRAKDKTTPKEVFKKALSKLVVRCLDHHRKPDCKYGRITCSEDFKYLARKLTLGITTKEVNRKGSGDLLIFTDQVKSRTKDYIKNYMKKFGPIYNNS